MSHKSSNFSDEKVNKNAATDKDKTDLNNSNHINGTSCKRKSSKDDIKRKKNNLVKKNYTWWQYNNHLNFEDEPVRVVKSVVDLAKSMISVKRNVTVSEFITRNDKWNKKAE